MTTTINASTSTGLVNTADTSGIIKLQSNGVTTNALAWVNYKGTSTQSIRASYNVSSVTYNGTGEYTVNFTNALADINYAVVASGGTGTGANKATFDVPTATPTTSAVRVGATNYLASLTDYAYVYVVIFGN